MRTDIQKFSDQARDHVANAIIGYSSQEIGEITDRIRIRINEENEKFFQILRQKAIGVTSAPSLDGWGEDWKALSDQYTAKKGHEKFYFKSGSLKRELLAMNPENVLGRATSFGFQDEVQRGVLSESNIETVSPRGRTRRVARYPRGFTIGGKKVGGQFASLTEVYKVIEGTITIDPMPEIKPSWLESHKDLAEYLGSFSTLMSLPDRLLNVRRRVDRPILVNYFKWWAEKKLSDAIRGEVA